MSTDRDELAKLLYDEGAFCGVCSYESYVTCKDCREVTRGYSDAILAAGYRKPRTITTTAELDALPSASLILDALNYCREAAKLTDGSNLWRSMGPAKVKASKEIALPATVLHEPEPAQ